jgi:hypothetical protein
VPVLPPVVAPINFRSNEKFLTYAFATPQIKLKDAIHKQLHKLYLESQALLRKPAVDCETHLLAADGFSIQFANGGATGKNAQAWCYRSFGDILASTTADWSFLPVPLADAASVRADGASSRADGASGRADTEGEVASEDEASGRPGGMADDGEASGHVVADVATRGDAAPSRLSGEPGLEGYPRLFDASCHAHNRSMSFPLSRLPPRDGLCDAFALGSGLF